MNDNLKGYKPNIAIPPGETLLEYLESMGMTQVDLAKRIGLTPKTVNEIINGKAPITAENALKLESIFGTPASFWNNLEANYQEAKARLDAEYAIKDETSIARAIPYPSLAKLKVVSPTRCIEEKVVNLRSFFGVASLHYVQDVQPVAFRKQEKVTVSSFALASWLRIGEVWAAEIETKPYDEKKLKELMITFRSLTLKRAEEFAPDLKDLCASVGIAFVLVPHLPKTYAHGATKWLTPQKALIQLSIRCSYSDIFWFSFFHELGHILLHSKKQAFAETGISNQLEDQADRFAAEKLIPNADYKMFLKKNKFTRESIIRFAGNIEIHPGIIVGKLQHDEIIGHDYFNDLRPRLIWR